ncbi:MAG: hypothetical protein IPJ74_25240 [Saprospiraceae bacterium]|nr:hypothetical protein [Saprospiraceae bacterium]
MTWGGMSAMTIKEEPIISAVSNKVKSNPIGNGFYFYGIMLPSLCVQIRFGACLRVQLVDDGCSTSSGRLTAMRVRSPRAFHDAFGDFLRVVFFCRASGTRKAQYS